MKRKSTIGPGEDKEKKNVTLAKGEGGEHEQPERAAEVGAG